MKILVLGGGNSPEREVSLRSAKAVAKACRAAGFDVDEADPVDGYATLDNLVTGTIVFPILHGKGGEDGEIQAELERRGLPFLGSDSRSSAICFDKAKTRQALLANGLSVADGGTVNRDVYSEHSLAGQPHVLKVTTGGSSIGTLIVRDVGKVKPGEIEEVFSLGPEAVIEELVEGIELTVPVLGDKALPVIEIRPPESGEFDYENKYNGATQEICPPESIDKANQKRAQQLAEQAHRLLGCRHLSRTDMILAPDGRIVILEINTMPGMTDQSLYPKSAAVAGLSFPELVKRFASLASSDS